MGGRIWQSESCEFFFENFPALSLREILILVAALTVTVR